MDPIGSPIHRAIFRFGGAILAVGFLVSLGMWLSSGNGLNWFTTASIVALFTFMRGTLRRTVMPSAVADWLKGFDSVFVGIRELVGNFSEEFVFRTAWAVIFGIVIATLEQGFVLNLLLQHTDIPDAMKGLLSLPLVLIPAYFVVGLLTMGQTHIAPSWLTHIVEGLREGFKIPRFELLGVIGVLASAIVRGLAGVLARGLAIVIFPVIFGNLAGGLTVGLLALLVIYTWDGIVAWHRRRTGRGIDHNGRVPPIG